MALSKLLMYKVYDLKQDFGDAFFDLSKKNYGSAKKYLLKTYQNAVLSLRSGSFNASLNLSLEASLNAVRISGG